MTMQQNNEDQVNYDDTPLTLTSRGYLWEEKIDRGGRNFLILKIFIPRDIYFIEVAQNVAFLQNFRIKSVLHSQLTTFAETSLQ